jgi:hypothetical protein
LYLGTGITTFFLRPRFSCSFLFGRILHPIFQKSIVPWYRFIGKKREPFGTGDQGTLTLTLSHQGRGNLRDLFQSREREYLASYGFVMIEAFVKSLFFPSPGGRG